MKKILTGTLGVMALALAFSVTAPQPAEARIVCHSGWGWSAGRCVRVQRVGYRYHHPYRYHHVRYVPHRGYYHRYR